MSICISRFDLINKTAKAYKGMASTRCEKERTGRACLGTQLYLTLFDPLGCSLPGSSVHGIFSGNNIGVGCHFPPPGDLPDPGIEPASPVSPALQDDSLPAEPSGKPCWLHEVFISFPSVYMGFHISES